MIDYKHLLAIRDMMSESTYVADTQLARALGALEQCEQEKKELQRLLHETEARLKELTKRASKLEATKEEVSAILCVCLRILLYCWYSE